MIQNPPRSLFCTMSLIGLGLLVTCSSSSNTTSDAGPPVADADASAVDQSLADGADDSVAGDVAPAADSAPAGAACWSQDECPADSFCDLLLGCEGEPLGLCTAHSECPDLMVEPPLPPVCGCDGVSYGSRCVAFFAGQRVDHGGPCDKPDQIKTCEQLELQYKAALIPARQCAGVPEVEACQQIADSALGAGCGCPIRVNSRNSLEPIITLWKEHKCPDLWPGCPPADAADCFGPTEPFCMATGLCQASPTGSGGP